MYQFFCQLCYNSLLVIKHHVHLTSAVINISCSLPTKESLPKLTDENYEDIHDDLDFSDLLVGIVVDRVKKIVMELSNS